jgi:hypothetical protein
MKKLIYASFWIFYLCIKTQTNKWNKHNFKNLVRGLKYRSKEVKILGWCRALRVSLTSGIYGGHSVVVLLPWRVLSPSSSYCRTRNKQRGSEARSLTPCPYISGCRGPLEHEVPTMNTCTPPWTPSKWKCEREIEGERTEGERKMDVVVGPRLGSRSGLGSRPGSFAMLRVTRP